MPLKKKTSMPKSLDKRNIPDGPLPDDAKNGQITHRSAAAANSGAPAAPVPKSSQMEAFEEGMHQFHARQFQKARDLFVAAANGPDRAVSHRARVHARMCASRLEGSGVVLSTPEEHYNYAITLINSRDLAGAQKHLRAALEGEPTADHVLYALAACQCLGGDLPGAYENLRRAIELQPRNRLAARQDPDFAAMAEHQAFARLLFPDKR
jgi:tetratricopeptide (TPR) repeat protein